MAKVSDVAHDKDGNQIENPVGEFRGTVPDWPSDDLLAANKAFWRLCLAKAQNKPAKDRWEEERYGVNGIVAEIRKSSVAKEMWPLLSTAQLNAFLASNMRYQYGNMEILDRGRGDIIGTLWIALEWRYDKAVAAAAYEAKYRPHKPRPGKNPKDAIDLQKEIHLQTSETPAQSDYVSAYPDGVASEPLSVAERLREAADVYEAVGKREKALNEARSELLAYLSDMRRVVEGL